MALYICTGSPKSSLFICREIYGEDNTAVWKNDLEIAYHDYVVVYFPEIYLKWKVWRADQVVIKKWVDQYLIAFVTRATVEDKVSGSLLHLNLVVETKGNACSLVHLMNNVLA